MSSPKDRLKEMKEIARSRSGECLSPTYINAHTHLAWKCHKGHVWEAKPHNVKRGSWCPNCKNRNPKYTIEDMHTLAQEKDGECLSETYVFSKQKLKWKCKEGHTWEATPSAIRIGRWCPICARQKRARKKLTIEEMHELAIEKGGKCLSSVYVNNNTPLTWECEKGHTWDSIPRSVKKGSWCPSCGSRRAGRTPVIRPMRTLQIIAKRKGGTCLSTRYTGFEQQIEWECKCRHRWTATYEEVFSGSWCPTCEAGLPHKELS
ncbi:hypothetical protein CN918_30570 [Priestia megaterium]|nr:hypothetical protein CN918_30570 [Priestia megaterium]